MDNKPDTLFQNFRKRIQGSSRTSKVASVVAFFALVSHIFFLGLFFFLHVTPMFYFNIFSVTFFTIIFLTSKNRSSYIFFYLICSIEVIAHQISAVYFIGADSSFHYFIILMGLLPFLVVEDHNKFSIVCAAVCGAIFVAVHLGFSGHQPPYVIDPLVLKIIKGVNIGSTLIVIDAIVLVFTRAVQQAEKEAYEQYTRAEHLLYNILPDSIAERLKISSKNIAESYDSVSVLFLDIVNFTQFSSHLSAEQLVSILNSLFSKFDVLCDKYHIEKIKTIGDSYMAAAGLPDRNDDNCIRICDFAIDMLETVRQFNKEHKTSLQVRIGIHTGPVVAGIIGLKKFIYDMWGMTVNFASRMESTSLPDRIQVSKTVYDKMKDICIFEEREPIEVKDHGLCQCYFKKKKK